MMRFLQRRRMRLMNIRAMERDNECLVEAIEKCRRNGWTRAAQSLREQINHNNEKLALVKRRVA